MLCGKGNWSSAGAAVCSRCAAGQAANAVGASACGDCEAGRFTCLGGMICASLAWYSRDIGYRDTSGKTKVRHIDKDGS